MTSNEMWDKLVAMRGEWDRAQEQFTDQGVTPRQWAVNMIRRLLGRVVEIASEGGRPELAAKASEYLEQFNAAPYSTGADTLETWRRELL